MSFRVLLIAALPVAVVAVAGLGPRWVAVARERRARRRAELQPLGPPIEKLAADLRRLLRLHGELTVSAHSAMCAHRVWAVEAAIGSRAIEAAAALGVPHPDRAQAASLTRTELSALLTAVAEQGLVLPRRVGHFTLDGRL
ncbi:hypothetical protein AB0M02_29605 [Actinoplanes sp. NPDC051861]|uniref:hypothetical protein n=1 Tax=Actinoplanes sp. NPDC051861 TaxID=3155170 RepID=UPI00344004C6